eukprot:2660761-Prorocentrum_lima.AAC.1
MPHFGATRHRSRPTGRARDALCSPWASSMVEGCVALAGFPMWWASGGRQGRCDQGGLSATREGDASGPGALARRVQGEADQGLP